MKENRIIRSRKLVERTSFFFHFCKKSSAISAVRGGKNWARRTSERYWKKKLTKGCVKQEVRASVRRIREGKYEFSDTSRHFIYMQFARANAFRKFEVAKVRSLLTDTTKNHSSRFWCIPILSTPPYFSQLPSDNNEMHYPLRYSRPVFGERLQLQSPIPPPARDKKVKISGAGSAPAYARWVTFWNIEVKVEGVSFSPYLVCDL